MDDIFKKKSKRLKDQPAAQALDLQELQFLNLARLAVSSTMYHVPHKK